MKSTLVILFFFILGFFCGYWNLARQFFNPSEYILYILYFLLFVIGINIGSEINILYSFWNNRHIVFLVPVISVIGTLAGGSLISFCLPLSFKDTLAISSGLGYYSLSSVMITQYSGEKAGIIALLANLIREVFTLVFAPLLVKYVGKIAPVISAGATSMDTTLPVINRYSGKEITMIAVINGIILTLLVPILISVIYSI